ncbi:hypothetical protein [Ruminococcus gauvreauii]|uniref:hypothetical protein n=1 Tax=Ruminococcus gauvreauii TaxID=438033 RepID=UPI003983FE1E
MGKVIDITEKLDFDENPKIKVRNAEIEVNADAATMLKVMGILGDNEEPGAKEVMGMYELMFSEKERGKIEKLKLNFKDFTTLVYTAINLINGEDTPGEQ